MPKAKDNIIARALETDNRTQVKAPSRNKILTQSILTEAQAQQGRQRKIRWSAGGMPAAAPQTRNTGKASKSPLSSLLQGFNPPDQAEKTWPVPYWTRRARARQLTTDSVLP